MSLTLKVTHIGETDKGAPLSVGDIVIYLSHLPGGNVKIRLPDDSVHIANPNCFQELR